MPFSLEADNSVRIAVVLRQLETRLRIDLWDRTEVRPARIAASLVLAHMYTSRWASLLTVEGEVQGTEHVEDHHGLPVMT